MQKPPGFDPQPLDDSESLFWRVAEPQASVRFVLLRVVGDRERARRSGNLVCHRMVVQSAIQNSLETLA